jgi:hypothetical protein
VRGAAFAIEHGAFDVWKGERRYAAIGAIVRARTEPASVILSVQHSGSLRYYAGRLTIRFDNLDDDWLDRAVEWIGSRGLRAYLLAEDWEVPDFERRFATQKTTQRLADAPVFVYRGESIAMLYDLSGPREPHRPAETIVEHAAQRCPSSADRRDRRPAPIRLGR